MPGLTQAVGARPGCKIEMAQVLHLGRLGSVYRHDSEPKWAINYYERALRLTREIGDRQGEGKALGTWGWPTRT